MTDNKLNDLAMQMVNSMKTMDDFKQIQQLMLQQFINNSLEAEMQEHLGYAKHEKSEQPNKRNGKMRKTVGTELGDIQIDTPRDTDSSVEPQLVKKNQTRITGRGYFARNWKNFRNKQILIFCNRKTKSVVTFICLYCITTKHRCKQNHPNYFFHIFHPYLY